MNRDNQQETATKAEIGWLAGIIDGEGSVTMLINRRRDRTQVLRINPRVTITNTDKAIIEKSILVLTKLGIGKYVSITKPNNSGLVKRPSKDITYIDISGFRRLARLLPILIPHLAGEKMLRAKALFEFINRRVSMAKNLKCGGNYQYNEIDVELMLKFLRLTKTKNYDHVSRLLNEYTQGAFYQKKVKMYSELDGNAERKPETAPAA